ncbi:uncharacterized protein LOC128243302 isoform X2 [Mya arenaria]|uniref:uncharacterized protein LOC128243302 isoform X2 n=1 Tax=Mya arenaria TaxID=6604 RepID=UPI0022E35AB3|nr:uncharacterized protein LOC128243302 isoform X2 [Mya arenaria]
MMFTVGWVLLVCNAALPQADYDSGWRPIIKGLRHVARLALPQGVGEVPAIVDVQLKVDNFVVPAVALPQADYDSGWRPIINGLRHVARLDLPHGIGEVPTIVDVLLKVDNFVVPAVGFRPDHDKMRSGPVVYIYDDQFVNVSASPSLDPFYTMIASDAKEYPYVGDYEFYGGRATVRVRAWTSGSLPTPDFHLTGTSAPQMVANNSDTSLCYRDIPHGLGEAPILLVARMRMEHDGKVFYADGVGATLEVYAENSGRTNAYLVYGYSNTSVRAWVSSAKNGALFDGRKHTWFDFYTSSGYLEVHAWKNGTLPPSATFNRRTNYISFSLNDDNGYSDVIYPAGLTRIQVSRHKEDTDDNNGFRFPGQYHLTQRQGVGEPKPVGYGGFSWGMKQHMSSGRETYVQFKNMGISTSAVVNASNVYIDDSFGCGINTEAEMHIQEINGGGMYVQSWLPLVNSSCLPPVIWRGGSDVPPEGSARGEDSFVRCDEGYHPEGNSTIVCDKYGYWTDLPLCLPNEKGAGSECNPSEDTCTQFSRCVFKLGENRYTCTCQDGFTMEGTACKCGVYLPNPDFNSDWNAIASGPYEDSFRSFNHGLGAVPVLVNVEIKISSGSIFPAMGFRPDQDIEEKFYDPVSSPAVYIYDDTHINVSVSTYEQLEITPVGNPYTIYLRPRNFKRSSFSYPGHKVRVRAWKLASLPTPDFQNTDHGIQAATSKETDSFYEVRHGLGEYPGLVIVRALLETDGLTFLADGVGSSMNVFYGDDRFNNAYLVYGFNNENFRVWVDASPSGAIFDGRKHTWFDFMVSRGTVEIYAWKLSTLTPYVTHRFSMDDVNVPLEEKLSAKYELDEAFIQVMVENTDPSSQTRGYRFSGSPFLPAPRDLEENFPTHSCIGGGFAYGIQPYKYEQYWRRGGPTRLGLWMPSYSLYSGLTLMCIADQFGAGRYTGSGRIGVGIMQVWVRPECGMPKLSSDYITDPIVDTGFGVIYNFTCSEGYRIEGDRAQIECLGNQEWKFHAYCTLLLCNYIGSSNIQFGEVSGWGNAVGRNRTVTCNDGYILVGKEVFTCLTSGEWTPIPVCVPSVGYECDLAVPVDMQCTGIAECVRGDSGDYVCECPQYYSLNGSKCIVAPGRLGSGCTPVAGGCADQKAACTEQSEGAYSCTCKPEYVAQVGVCKEVVLGDPCTPNVTLCEDGIAECREDVEGTYQCTCPQEYLAIGGQCSAGLLGEMCVPAKHNCLDTHAVCMVDGAQATCQCMDGYQQRDDECQKESGGLPTWAIILIALCCVLAAAIIVGCALRYCRKSDSKYSVEMEKMNIDSNDSEI